MTPSVPCLWLFEPWAWFFGFQREIPKGGKEKITDLLTKNAEAYDGFNLRHRTWNVAISNEKILDVFAGEGEDRRAIR